MRIATGLEAALNLAKHYAQTLMGEMIHASDLGVRFFDTAYNRPRLALFAEDMRRRIMQVDGVLSVSRLDARISEDELLYTADIVTRWGVGAVSNIQTSSGAPIVGNGAKCNCNSTLFGFYIENGDLIFYSENEPGTSPQMYIDDDGYLILEAR